VKLLRCPKEGDLECRKVVIAACRLREKTKRKAQLSAISPEH